MVNEELQIALLRDLIMVLDSAYYGMKGISLIPDRNYDYFKKWLEELIEKNPKFQDDTLPPHVVGHDWGKF